MIRIYSPYSVEYHSKLNPIHRFSTVVSLSMKYGFKEIIFGGKRQKPMKLDELDKMSSPKPDDHLVLCYHTLLFYHGSTVHWSDGSKRS